MHYLENDNLENGISRDCISFYGAVVRGLNNDNDRKLYFLRKRANTRIPNCQDNNNREREN